MGWEQRPPSEFQLGNGTLLATFDGMGELEQLFAPYIDALSARLGAYRTSIIIPGGPGGPGGHARDPEIIRLEAGLFHCRLRLLRGSQVLEAEYQHKFRPLRLKRRLGLHPTEAALLDQWEIEEETAGLVHESIPWMGQATSAHCSLYHPTYNGLVHHRGRRWVGVMAREKPQWVRVGHLSEHDRYRLWQGERLFAPLGAHDFSGYPAGPARLGWDQVVQGPTTWGCFALPPARRHELLLICADSERALGRMLDQMNHLPSERYFEMIQAMVERRHAPGSETLRRIKSPRVRSFCERSIDVLHALQDGGTGALLAAAEVDPHSRLSGGYGYSWPRDGAFLASALGAFGFHERTEKYFKFCADTQDPSGAWWQRYLASGHAGPSWGRIQIDEPATVIAAAWLQFRRTRDLFWLEGFWPVIRKGLTFLEEFHSDPHPMGLPSHDLWEERTGIHAYSLAAISAAFRGGAYLSRALREPTLQARYHGWSRRIDTLILEKFVLPETPTKRSFVSSGSDFERGDGYWDESADCSLLGLIRPFGVLGLKDPAARRIVDRVRRTLWHPSIGGVLRYERDAYRGGNPWVLTTLWLGSVELAMGNLAEAKECFEWAMAKATPLEMLSEQVHRETGHPFWVIPLGWSHAMYLLFVRDTLDRGLETAMWDGA